MKTMELTVVTGENVDAIGAFMPCDQYAEIVPGCVTWGITHSGGRGGQMTVWPNGRGAVAWGGNSRWGEWDEERRVLVLDETYDDGKAIIVNEYGEEQDA
jgi:hypothetical protein